MPEQRERRRSDRERYPELRFYARVLILLAYTIAGLGVLVSVLVLLSRMSPMERVVTIIPVITGTGFAYLLMRAMAQAIYLLFDVARNSKAAREMVEKASGGGRQPTAGSH